MKKFPIRWHVLAWLAYSAYVMLDLILFPTRQGEYLVRFLWLNASFLATRIIVFYFCYLVVYPRFLRNRRLLQLTAGLGTAALLFTAVRAGIEEVAYPTLLGFRNYELGTTISFYLFDNFFRATPAIVLSAALWAGERTLRQERENQQLRTEKQAAETAFLKTQINPHFLYNTLNLLYGMAYPVSKPLAAALLRLAELMRYMLYDSAADQVALSHEIDYLRNYLALYHLRFPNQLFVDFTVTGEPADRRIAPLVLIPFVENAFKHGILDDPAHPVRICLRVEPQEVVFRVGNRISADHKDATSGIGLPNLRRRLALQYPGRHQLSVSAENGQFDTLLRVAS